jgi:hypothetical protein
MIRNRALGSFYFTKDHLNFTGRGIAGCELKPCEILLVGLGKGFRRDQKERLKTIGVDLAIIWGGGPANRLGDMPPGGWCACHPYWPFGHARRHLYIPSQSSIIITRFITN